MKKVLVLLGFCTVVYIVFSAFKSETKTSDDEIHFPEGYRNWTHVKTYIVRPKNPAFTIIGGFNHVYANDKAMIGYRTGYFPNGSIIVSDVISVLEDSLNTREHERVHVDVMVRDSTKYKDFNGWRFETFDKNSHTLRLLTPAKENDCGNCHRRTDDMVFSTYRD